MAAGFSIYRYLLADDDDIAVSLDSPACNRIECGRAYRVAGLQAETGVVPRTSNSLVDDYSVGKRTVIVGAVGANGEDLVT